MKWTSGDLLRKYSLLYIHEETRWGRHNSAKDFGKCSITGNTARARPNSRVGVLGIHNPWCISPGSVEWWDGQMRGVNIAHIKCWVRNFSGFKLPRGVFAIGVFLPSPRGPQSNRVFCFTGQTNVSTKESRIPGESVDYLVGPKARMDCGPRGLGPGTPRVEKPSKEFLVTAQQILTYQFVHSKLP